MSQVDEKFNTIKWVVRIIAVAVTAFGLPFYFGYGNPLPFINPNYTLWDNMWLTIFPIMFIGLLVGLKLEKIGGYLLTFSIGFGLIGGLLLEGELVVHMLLPFGIGILYLIVGYKREKV